MTKWELRGTYTEGCNCDSACPCVFLSPPTGNDCTVVGAWHIDKGTYDDLKVDGLNVALAAHRLRDASWKDEGSGCVIYIDERATEAQKAALAQIFSGKASGVPSLLTRITARLQAVKTVPIEYKVEGKKRFIKIPRTIELETEVLVGESGGEVTVSNFPNWYHTSAVLAKSRRLNYHDQGLDWEIAEKNGFHSPFTYKGQ